jgi:hypothetical protein
LLTSKFADGRRTEATLYQSSLEWLLPMGYISEFEITDPATFCGEVYI